jgi:DNA-binding IclR family transcriptional regulator
MSRESAGPPPHDTSTGNSTVRRALAILQYLARQPGPHGVRSVAHALNMSPSTAFRLLATLQQAGFAEQDAATERYSIGLNAVQLGIAALSAFDITRIAPSRLRSLADETGESAFLAVLDDVYVVYLLKEEAQRAIRTTIALGSRKPTHATALGKTFLAGMPAADVTALLRRAGMPATTVHTITDLNQMREDLAYVRARGYAVAREEDEDGLMCVAASVRDHAARAIAALSIAGPTERLSPNEERFGRRVVAAALEVSTALGYVA